MDFNPGMAMVSEIQHWPGHNLPSLVWWQLRWEFGWEFHFLDSLAAGFAAIGNKALGVFLVPEEQVSQVLSAEIPRLCKTPETWLFQRLVNRQKLKQKNSLWLFFLLRIYSDKKTQRKACRGVTNCCQNVSLTEKYYPFFIRNSSE